MRQNATASPHAEAKLARHVWWPNITGSVGWINAYGNATDSGTSALYWLNEGETASQLTGDRPGSLDIAINASRSSAIYNGSKMQASALQTLACIRF